jgi:hypothetical protein
VRGAYRLQALAVLELNERLRLREIVQAEAAYIQHALIERLEQADEIPAHRTVVHLH